MYNLNEKKQMDLKEYLPDEIKKHVTENDLWLILGGRVCDVSNFKDHPGGPDILKSVGGTDCTDEFLQVSHSRTANKMVENYVIGKIQGGKVSKLFEESENQSGVNSFLIFFISILIVIGYYYINY